MLSFKSLKKDFDKKAIKIEKRYRLVISVVLLTSLMIISSFFGFDKVTIFLPILIILTYFFTYFSLIEGINKVSWFGLFLMPQLVTIAFYFVYYLFPGRWLTRVPFSMIYGVSIYAVLLCSNIFNIGVEKSLGLYRAAFSINFFYQTIVSFLIFNLIFSLKQIFLVNMLAAGIVGFILGLHLYWTIRLKKHIETEALHLSLVTGLVLCELAMIISFIPLKMPVYSLFLTSSYYSLAGLTYSHIDQRLFKETVREYVSVFIFVLIITLLSISF